MSTEFEILQRILPELEADGYEVYLSPNRELLPIFFSKYTPDAIALRSDKSIAIEIVRDSLQPEEKLESIAGLFEGHDDWELRVYRIKSGSSKGNLPVQQREAIESRITNITELTELGHLESALLLAWATFEALGRALATDKFRRSQTPGRLVEILAQDGYLTPTEADQLRKLARKRNGLIHGDFQASVSEAEIKNFLGVLNVMLQMRED